MKKILLLLALIIVMSSVCSCGKEPAAQELLDSIVSVYKDIPSCRYIYNESAGENSKNYMSDELAGYIYYGQKKDYVAELDLLDDYAVRLADNQSAFEIHVMKARNRSEVSDIIELCRRRLELLQNREIYLYVPDAYEDNVDSARIYSNGKYVFLLVTSDNEAAISKIDAVL